MHIKPINKIKFILDREDKYKSPDFMSIFNKQRKRYLAQIEKLELDHQKALTNIEELKNQLNSSKFKKLEQDYQNALSVYKELKKEIDILQGKLDFSDFGFDDPLFLFERSEDYKTKQNEINWQLFRLHSTNKATEFCEPNVNKCIKDSWIKSGSTDLNRTLIVFSFNIECISLLKDIRWNNFEAIIKKFHRIYKYMNQLGKNYCTQITKEYFDLQEQVLHLEFEYQNKVYQEKEEARMIKEERREEEKALREIERERKKAEQEEIYYSKALIKVKKEIENATGTKYDLLLEKINYLETELLEAKENKERAISMAQQTRRGYVYVISNIGSFGHNIFKIGMTRRLDPTDRVRELSNASVPFGYDIHAMIYSEDAPMLETKLHNAFEDKKVNAINGRKEFFKVQLDNIEKVVRESGIVVDFIKLPEARDYRESLSIQNKATNTNLNYILEHKAIVKYPKSIFNFQVIDSVDLE